MVNRTWTTSRIQKAFSTKVFVPCMNIYLDYILLNWYNLCGITFFLRSLLQTHEKSMNKGYFCVSKILSPKESFTICPITLIIRGLLAKWKMYFKALFCGSEIRLFIVGTILPYQRQHRILPFSLARKHQ